MIMVTDQTWTSSACYEPISEIGLCMNKDDKVVFTQFMGFVLQELMHKISINLKWRVRGSIFKFVFSPELRSRKVEDNQSGLAERLGFILCEFLIHCSKNRDGPHQYRRNKKCMNQDEKGGAVEWRSGEVSHANCHKYFDDSCLYTFLNKNVKKLVF